jgi:nucleotide-binding universal stress UspA family protein
VGERAKVISVLRKAEELMSLSIPPPNTASDVRRAFELASGRCGLTFPEYRALADGDPALVELERQVIADARRRWGAPVAEIEPRPPEPEEEEQPDTILERILVPVDYSMESHRAVALALELRRTHGSAVCLFHAAQSTGSDDWLAGIGSPSVAVDWVAEAHGRLRRFLANVAPGAGEGIDVRARVGLPLDTLGQEAHGWGATLVIATARVQSWLVRSPAERLLRELGLPVLIIPTGTPRRGT